MGKDYAVYERSENVLPRNSARRMPYLSLEKVNKSWLNYHHHRYDGVLWVSDNRYAWTIYKKLLKLDASCQSDAGKHKHSVFMDINLITGYCFMLQSAIVKDDPAYNADYERLLNALLSKTGRTADRPVSLEVLRRKIDILNDVGTERLSKYLTRKLPVEEAEDNEDPKVKALVTLVIRTIIGPYVEQVFRPMDRNIEWAQREMLKHIESLPVLTYELNDSKIRNYKVKSRNENTGDTKLGTKAFLRGLKKALDEMEKDGKLRVFSPWKTNPEKRG